MSRNDGCVSIWGLSLDFGQRWRAALREGDLHVVLACLELRLHAVHKLLIA